MEELIMSLICLDDIVHVIDRDDILRRNWWQIMKTNKVDSNIAYISIDECFNRELTAEDIGNIYGKFYKTWNQRLYNDFTNVWRINTKTKYKNLSKGLKIKLKIAFYISTSPKAIILDSIMDALDIVYKHDFLKTIKETTNNKFGIIFSSLHKEIFENEVTAYYLLDKNQQLFLKFLRKAQMIIIL
ncbi:hypothetical protein ACGCUQ_00475 [Eubacteriales bacterium KG127]